MPPANPAAAPLLERASKLEADGDLTGALSAYEAALALSPNDPDILSDIARVAGRLDMPETAETLWRLVAALDPTRLEAIDGQARSLAALGRFGEAIALLQAAIPSHAEDAKLWNTLGVVLTQAGQAEDAITFLDEAVRLDEALATARYNRGAAQFDLGRLDAASADFTQARKLARKPGEIAEIDFAASTLLLARGQLGEGWDAYEARLADDWPSAPLFEAPGERWTPKTAITGKHLLILAEQGLGDEAMFASIIPSVLNDLGPDGRLTLAVEPRLVELFGRSFPAATVLAHTTDRLHGRRRRIAPSLDGVDYWAPIASLPRRYRRSLGDFPQGPGYLQPDPARVAHWRGWLGAGPPVVGLSWRSGMQGGDRRRVYPAPEQWAPVLTTPGVRFVNVQYGDCTGDLAAFRELTAATILQPPDLNIREDIDDLCALLAALDLTLTIQNATGALAGASGAQVAFVNAPASWPCLGTGAYPWYARARAFTAAKPGDWGPAMAGAAEAVAALG